MAQEDYYSLLGVDRQAPEREIKRAYYSLARQLHPDKAKTPEEARENAERLATISKAYNTLKDPTKRSTYDTGKPSAGTVSPSPEDTNTLVNRGMPPAAEKFKSDRQAPVAAPATGKPAGRGRAVATASTTSPDPATAKVSSSEMASQRVLTAQKAFVKGMEFYKNQEFKKAVPFFEAAVQNDPESEAHYHMKLAISLMRTKGSFNRAVEAAERACDMDPYNVEFKLGLGEIYEMAGVPTKARSVYEDVLKWDGENDKAKFRLRQLEVQEQKNKPPTILAKIFPSLFGKK